MLSKKLGLIILAIAVSFLLVGPVLASDYTPLPGVLSPGEVDFGGQTINIVTRTNIEALFAPGEIREGRLERAEELFNVKIEQVDLGRDRDGEAVLTRIMAGESANDIFRISTRSGFFQALGMDGLLPIDEILPNEYFDSLHSFERGMLELTRFRGNIYGFSTEYMVGQAPTGGRPMWANMDLINEEGLPDPLELYRADDWTWETYEAIVSAATRDTTGDGEIDQWGRTTDGSHRIDTFARNSNNAYPAREIDGRMTFVGHEGPYVRALDQLREWEENYTAPGGRGAVNEHWWDGNVAIASALGWGGAADLHELFEYHVIPYPQGPDKDDYALFYLMGIEQVGSLAVNARDPEKLIALHDYLWRPDDEWDMQAWLADTNLTRQGWEIFMEFEDTWAHGVDIFRYHWPSELWDAKSEVLNEGRSAAAAMEEVRPVVQSYLDDFWGN